MQPAVNIVFEEYTRIYQQEHTALSEIVRTLQAQLNSVTPIGIISQFPAAQPVPTIASAPLASVSPAVAQTSVPALPIQRSVKPSDAEIRARELLQKKLMIADEDDIDPKLLEPATDDKQRIIELTRRHDVPINKNT